MSRVERMSAVLAESEPLCGAADVQAAFDAMAARIQADYAGRDPVVLVVMTGGFMVAAEVLKRVGFPLTMDYLHATRYRGTTNGGALQWKRKPEVDLAGRHVLVVDDILDEGHTLVSIRSQLQAQRPASLRVAVLAVKRHDRRVAGAHAEYTGLELPDRYVFGCGMDYHDYWRQLPAIYAVREA